MERLKSVMLCPCILCVAPFSPTCLLYNINLKQTLRPDKEFASACLDLSHSFKEIVW